MNVIQNIVVMKEHGWLMITLLCAYDSSSQFDNSSRAALYNDSPGVAQGICKEVPLNWNSCMLARTASVTLFNEPTSSAKPCRILNGVHG